MAGRPGRAARAPIAVAALAVVGIVLVALPLVALAERVPWTGLPGHLGDDAVLDALRLSLATSLIALGLAILVGVPLAWCLARLDLPGRRWVRAVVTLPMVLPPVVGGIALLSAFGRRGVAGPALGDVGIHLPFTIWGAAAAEAFVALPFLVVSAEAGFRGVDPDLEAAARTLGAPPRRVFALVTVPAARGALLAGAVLAWARALGEFGATITFNGNLPGTTQTLPLLAYVRMQAGDTEGALVVSAVLLAVSLVALVALRDRWWGGVAPTHGTRVAIASEPIASEPPSAAPSALPAASVPAEPLVAAIHVDRGGFELVAEITARPGETTVVVGPNGSGKTTLLHALAGLIPIDAGSVALGDRSLDDPDSGTFVPPENRRFGMVLQGHALFPHLSVVDNVAFGVRDPRSGLRPRRSVRRDVAGTWLRRFGVDDLADRFPPTLSGGQAQRVAFVRTLAAAPQVLLFDEPFAALDASVRGEVRRRFAADLVNLAGPRILVTHDPVDAVVLADQVVVLEAGRVVQAGSMSDLVTAPATPYVADLLGTNRLDAVTTAADGTVRLPGGADLVVSDREGVLAGIEPGSPVVAVVAPHAIALHRERPSGSPRNVWAATILSVEDHMGRIRVVLEGPARLVAEVTPSARDDLDLRTGTEVWISVKASEVAFHRAERTPVASPP